MRKITWERYDDEEEEDEDEEELPVKELPFRLISHKHIDLADDFNLWVGHTNFPVTVDDVENLEIIPGVESLDIYSRYRFRVGVGQLFNEDKVKVNIEYVLNSSSDILEYLHDETKEKIDELMKDFDEEKNWAILVLPNGEITTYVNKDDKIFTDKLHFLEEIQEITSCELITSEK